MNQVRRSEDNMWHITFDPKGRVYVRLGQNPGFIMSEAEGREFFKAGAEVFL